MSWRNGQPDLRDLGRRYAAEHSAWLTRVIGPSGRSRAGGGGGGADLGGFAAFRREKAAEAERLARARASRELAPGCPRIPTRLVDEGGFDRLMSTRAGRRRAATWWRVVLSRLRLR